MRGSWSLALVLLPALGACARPATGRTPAPAGATAPAITPGDLRARSSLFAADSMQGRRAGTPGNAHGNAYIADELARLGLRPGGDDGGYLQGAAGELRGGHGPRHSPGGGGFPETVPRVPPLPAHAFAVSARPIAGARAVYIGTLADSAALPSRTRRPPASSGAIP